MKVYLQLFLIQLSPTLQKYNCKEWKKKVIFRDDRNKIFQVKFTLNKNINIFKNIGKNIEDKKIEKYWEILKNHKH